MKTAYSVFEENNLKTILIFLLYFVLFFLIAYFIGFLFESYEYFWGILIFAIFYSLLNAILGEKIGMFILGAKEIKREDYPELFNLVENLSITAGLPKSPRIFLIQTEAMNAFAFGTSYRNYLIGVTQGLIKKLEKSELEAVIAHEISHLKNNDTRLMTIAVFLGGVFGVLTEIIFRLSGWGIFQEGEKRSGISFVFFIIGLVLLVLSPIFATLIQLAISRKREFMADAGSALLTRNPLALASALEKIANSSQRYFYDKAVYSSLFIVNPLETKRGFVDKINALFSTHPPVEERIKVLREMVI